MTRQRKTPEAVLIETVWAHYARAGRHDLPWRQTDDPYRIAVSEIMLQQTQVTRVIPKYRAFLRAFPSTARLANAPLAEVLRCWQGLGYNRRARMLQAAAAQVHTHARGRWPRSYDGLLALPGIGPYTAGAIAAFAYNQAVPLIETNIRTVYLFHLFPEQTDVPEEVIRAAVARTLDQDDPRRWYWALMDYGAYLKQSGVRDARRAQSYSTQTPFRGSRREVRGAIVAYLSTGGTSTERVLIRALPFQEERIRTALATLEHDGLVVRSGRSYALPT